MKYFVFRNNTIEPFFTGIDCTFSDYGAISPIPDDVDSYIWCYQAPMRPDNQGIANEILGYADTLKYLVNTLSENRTFIIFTIELIQSTHIILNDINVSNAVNSFNITARNLASTHSNVKTIDIQDFYQNFSCDTLIDWKFWFLSQMPWSPKTAKPFKSWLGQVLAAIEMKRKKCLVLDLDNTLWGGVLGEDGINGIKVGGDYPGNAFAWWQKALSQLSEYGIILAVCSKNNEADVKELWEKNPFVIIKEDRISSYRINWNDKASNIQEIAKELNIGLDSMVFIDDNPTERELIKQMLPMVVVPDFPEQPYQLPLFYHHIVNKYFKIYSLTAEDIAKTAQYKANADRTKAQRSFNDFGDFLKSLEMELTISPASQFNIPRIAQMTQKTNQFNLTTHRYTETEIKRMVDEGHRIFCLNVSDRFGDNGITGCIIMRDNDIDSLLLSCRVLGKGIEKAFLLTALSLLKDEGVDIVTSSYIPTAKNSQTSNFYDQIGFSPISQSEEKTLYQLDLSNFNPQIEVYYSIKITNQ